MGGPARVVAWTRTLLHQIETEDTVQAMLEWPNGALGSLHASTAGAGPPKRIEIVGTGGTLRIERGELTFQQFDTDLRDHVAHSPQPFSAPTLHPVGVALEPGAGDHVSVYRNLHEAILHGAPLTADGAAGRVSLELANAMIYSSHTQDEVVLPLDRRRYAALLADLRARHATP
jgi:predicted dehydrogenase